MDDIVHVLPSRNKLGEGPVWSADEQKLYWVDILNNSFSRYDPISGTQENFQVAEPIGVLALRASGGLVMATKTGFAFWDEQQQELNYVARLFDNKPHMRFNDGAVDCRGRFWAGSAGGEAEGSLYRLDPDGSVHEMITGVSISNGIGWSPDNTIMYYTDSPLHIIYTYDFDAETGAISNRRTFAHTPDEAYEPDGLAVDSEGYIWSACWNAAKIIRYAPDGTIDSVIQVPALRTTSCVFGGPDLEDLYITSSRADLSAQELEQYPFSGDLFCLKTGIKGLLKFKFAS
jgi:sugar lactone lactonase YvrE